MKTKCQFCEKEIIGRAGIKFCSPICKARKHQENKKASQVEIVEEINKILLKNRMILRETIGNQKQMKTEQIVLSKQGFNFKHFTGMYLNRQGKTYYYVYDFAWMEFSTQEVLIVKK